MKPTFSLIVSILLFALSSCIAQEVSCLELITMTECKDFTCFSDFITKKDYCYSESEETSLTTTYRFISCDSMLEELDNGLAILEIATISFTDKGIVSTHIGTSSIEYKQRLLDQALNLSFIIYDTIKLEDSILTSKAYYKSVKYPNIIFYISTYKISSHNSEELEFWTLSFERNK